MQICSDCLEQREKGIALALKFSQETLTEFVIVFSPRGDCQCIDVIARTGQKLHISLGLVEVAKEYLINESAFQHGLETGEAIAMQGLTDLEEVCHGCGHPAHTAGACMVHLITTNSTCDCPHGVATKKKGKTQ